ncbi:adaptor protein NBP2, partial [Ascoidea rubescens DSM 1968]
QAYALYDFVPENDNEIQLKTGQFIYIVYRHGQGWLVAQDPTTGKTGLVPEQYVQLI